MSKLMGKAGIALLALIPTLFSPAGSPAWSQETEHYHGMHGADHDLVAHAGHGAPKGEQDYTIQFANYTPPDIALLDTGRGRHHFRHALHESDRPLILQFIYTTCPGVCPLLSSLMADVLDIPGQRAAAFRRWSVSVDPERDTPERLGNYGRMFGSAGDWTLMTGAQADIEALQKSFDAYQDNKMDHEPSTFIWPGQGSTWLRLDGFPTAEELFAEAQSFVHQAGR